MTVVWIGVPPDLYKLIIPVLDKWISAHHPEPFYLDNIPVDESNNWILPEVPK